MGYFPFHSNKKLVNEELIMKGKYTIPTSLPKNIKIIISRMMEYIPEKRITFKDILNCEWFKENKNILNKTSINQGINIFKQKYPIDDNILKIFKYYKKNNTEISEDIQNNKCNYNISAYKQIAKYLHIKNISTVNDYNSKKYNNYINNKINYYSENLQKENMEKYMNDQIEKNKKIGEIEENFYLNAFKVLEELKQVKVKLVDQNYLINNNEKKDNNKDKNYTTVKKDRFNNNINKKLGSNINVKFSSLKSEKRNKEKNNKKVKIKNDISESNSGFPSSKNLPLPKKHSPYRPSKDKNDNELTLPTYSRKRIFTVRMKKPKQRENLNISLNNNKNNSTNESNNKKEEENYIDKEDFEIPIRKRIYSTVKKKQQKNNKTNKKKSDKKINNSLMKIREEKNEEDPLFQIQRKRIYSTLSKKERNNKKIQIIKL